jgi:hypothetical protein
MSMTHDMIHNSCSTILSCIGIVHSLKQGIKLTVQKCGNSSESIVIVYQVTFYFNHITDQHL